MKPFTSLILCGTLVAAAYEYVVSENAAHRLSTGQYKQTSAMSVWDAGKALHVSDKAKASDSPWKSVCYEFDDVVIMALAEDDMKECYRNEVVLKCIPSFMKR